MSQQQKIVVQLDKNALADQLQGVAQRSWTLYLIYRFLMYGGILLLAVVGYYSGAFTEGSKLVRWQEKQTLKHYVDRGPSIEVTNALQQLQMAEANHSPYLANAQAAYDKAKAKDDAAREADRKRFEALQ